MVAVVYMRGGHTFRIEKSVASVASTISADENTGFITGFTSAETGKNIMLNVDDVVAVEPAGDA